MNLQKKIAIVTGASSGIGAAFCKKLIEKGATVYGLARRAEKLEEIRRSLGSSFLPVVMDIGNQAEIAGWVEKEFTGNHLPHILINNAGLAKFGNVDMLSVEEWDRMIRTNLSGIFYMTREIVPLMKMMDEYCHIVNISSIAGTLGNPQMSGYNASKYGVRGFSQALFKELRYDKIKVTAMFPGSIATDFFKIAANQNSHSNMMHPDDVADTLIHILETPDNFLIDEIKLRPLNPKNPDER